MVFQIPYIFGCSRLKCKEFVVSGWFVGKKLGNKKSKVKSIAKNYKDKNLIIDRIFSRLDSIFVKVMLCDRKLTKVSFIREYNRLDDFKTFFDFAKDYRRKLQSNTEYTIIKVHLTCLNKWRRYNPRLHFDDILFYKVDMCIIR